MSEILNRKDLPKYYLVSLKWTSKKDDWFTFWGEIHAGYYWQQHQAGLYSLEEAKEIHGKDDTIMVDAFLIKDLWVELKYLEKGETKTKIVLPNSEKVRKALNIQLIDLKALHKSTFL